jgi:hypothetical protein
MIVGLFVALASLCIAANNPISLASVVVLGNQTSGNDPGTYRDAGYEGQIGNTYLQVYGTYCTSYRCTTEAQVLTANCKLIPSIVIRIMPPPTVTLEHFAETPWHCPHPTLKLLPTL